MKKSILLWSVILGVLFLTARWILSLFGLQFRIWIREPVTLLIAAGTAAGILQLLLRIHAKPVKIITIVLWAAALVFCCIYGFWIFALLHRYEITDKADLQGTRCVVEHEPLMWESRSLFFAYHGWFVCGNEVLDKEGYACGAD